MHHNHSCNHTSCTCEGHSSMHHSHSCDHTSCTWEGHSSTEWTDYQTQDYQTQEKFIRLDSKNNDLALNVRQYFSILVRMYLRNVSRENIQFTRFTFVRLSDEIHRMYSTTFASYIHTLNTHIPGGSAPDKQNRVQN